nr:MAG TPA_asm: hypothetical protein [Caudoviricetes sp.]
MKAPAGMPGPEAKSALTSLIIQTYVRPRGYSGHLFCPLLKLFHGHWRSYRRCFARLFYPLQMLSQGFLQNYLNHHDVRPYYPPG